MQLQYYEDRKKKVLARRHTGTEKYGFLQAFFALK